jgi:hypothetical protein
MKKAFLYLMGAAAIVITGASFAHAGPPPLPNPVPEPSSLLLLGAGAAGLAEGSADSEQIPRQSSTGSGDSFFKSDLF